MTRSTLSICILGLVAISSASNNLAPGDRMAQLSKREPLPGAIPFVYSGLLNKRQATAAKVVIGTSNPPAQDVNTLGDSTPSIGDTSGNIKKFAAGARFAKRSPQATAAKVVIGTSNPPPQDVNTLGDSDPSVGKTNGVIQAFKAGGLVRRQATAAKVVLGTSNPSIASSDVNNLGDDSQATESSAGGDLQSFSAEDAQDAAEEEADNAGADEVDDGEDVNLNEKRNMISHHLATRGILGGGIELF